MASTFVNAGIKECFLSQSGNGFQTLEGNAFGMGTRQNGSFTINHINESKDRTGKVFPNMLNFKAEINTMQILDLAFLKAVIGSFAKDGECDVAVITSGIEKITSNTQQVVRALQGGTGGGIFVFRKPTVVDLPLCTFEEDGTTITFDEPHNLDTSNVIKNANIGSVIQLAGQTKVILTIPTDSTVTVDSAMVGIAEDPIPCKLFDGGLGFDFELSFSMKDRQLKFTLERAFRYEVGLALIESAVSRLIGWEADRVPSIDDSKVSVGFINPDFIPNDLIAYFGDEVLSDFSCTVKSKSSKNGFNSSLINAITVEMKATCSGANYEGLKKVLAYENIGEAITIDLDPSGTSQQIVFGKDGLTKVGNVTVDDDKREATFTIAGEYELDYVDVDSDNVITFNKYLQ